jgi:predicted nucleic acid-binding protein
LPAILDSSAAVAWFVPDERNSQAQSLLDQIIEEGAVVPLHWALEVGNALLMAMRRRRISVDQRRRALDQFVDLQLTVDNETTERAWTRSLELADRFQLTLYDACYLELAQRRALPLATLDRDLRAASEKLGINLLGI